MTGKSVKVTTDYREKQLQRALLQYSKPENANLVREALTLCGRADLIGNGPECLVRPAFGKGGPTKFTPDNRPRARGSNGGAGRGGKSSARTAANGRRPATSGASSKKLSRIFGDDASRIRAEAERMSKGNGKSAKSGSSKARVAGKSRAKNGK